MIGALLNLPAVNRVRAERRTAACRPSRLLAEKRMLLADKDLSTGGSIEKYRLNVNSV